MSLTGAGSNKLFQSAKLRGLAFGMEVTKSCRAESFPSLLNSSFQYLPIVMGGVLDEAEKA